VIQFKRWLAIGLAMLLPWTSQGVQAADCTGLLGTWRLTYNIGNTTYRDTIVIQHVSGRSVSGEARYFDYDIPVRGHCVNNTIFLAERFADADTVLNSWYFTKGRPSFARYMGVFLDDRGDTLESGWISATVRKISTSTKLAPLSNQGWTSDGPSKRELLEEFLRSRRSLQ